MYLHVKVKKGNVTFRATRKTSAVNIAKVNFDRYKIKTIRRATKYKMGLYKVNFKKYK